MESLVDISVGGMDPQAGFLGHLRPPRTTVYQVVFARKVEIRIIHVLSVRRQLQNDAAKEINRNKRRRNTLMHPNITKRDTGEERDRGGRLTLREGNNLQSIQHKAKLGTSLTPYPLFK